MIINWSISDLERVFAGLGRALKITGNKKYYEYRRNLLPYALWVQQNLDYDELAELTKTYIDYIDEVEAGQESVLTKYKPPFKPPFNPDRWWKSITKSNLTTILMNMDPDLYRDWKGRPIKEYVEDMKNQSTSTQKYIAFYNKMWQDIGPLNLLFWMQHQGGNWQYRSEELWDGLPWQLRMRLRAHNVRIVWKASDTGEWGFKDFKNVYLDNHLPGSSEGLPSFSTTLDFWRSFFDLYSNYISQQHSIYRDYKKGIDAYNSFNPEVGLFLKSGLEDVGKALQIIEFVRGSQPVVNLLGGISESRKSTLPSEVPDFHTFTQLAKNLGFNPDLGIFLIHICSKCEGAGGQEISGKPIGFGIRVCSACQGLGVDIDGQGSGGIPKLYY
ncbi:MAG TPA: hypothetical protein EYF95_05390, partial [Flavobacteriales bacterium]|nr:hypothetical protein [Flavobacteriales bacterium]